MADRSVSVKLLADIDGFVRGMDQAKAKARDVAQAVEQHAAKNAQAYQTVGAGLLTVGTLAAAGIGLAISKYVEFDAQMSAVQAATGESAANMEILRQTALDFGASTVFSATEAAGAIEELAKAGLTTSQIVGGALAGALDLAAASGISVASAAETTATTLNQFQLEGEEATHVADLLAAGAGKAQGGVEELSAALAQSALVSSQMGLSVEDTTGALAMFASAGLLGSDAGTSFRNMLLRIANPTKEAATLMDELGLSFYDANGEFVGMESVAGQLSTQMSTLTQEQRDAAMATLFGADAIRAANVLYQEGAQGVTDWTAAVDDQGYAAEQAAARLDNLKGDIEALGGAFDTLLINMGEHGDGPLRFLVSGLTDVVDGFNELDPVAQGAITTLGLATAAIGLTGGAALLALPKIAEFKTALATLNVTAATTRTALSSTAAVLGGPWGVGIAAASSGLLLVNEAQRAANLSAEEWVATIREASDATDLFTAANREWVAGAEMFRDLAPSVTFDFVDDLEKIPQILDRATAMNDNFWESFNAAENVGLEVGGFTQELSRIDTHLGQMDFETVVDGFEMLASSMNLNEEQTVQLLDLMPNVREAIIEQANALERNVLAADGSVSTAELLEFAQEDLGEATEDATTYIEAQEEGLDELRQAFEEVTGVVFDLTDAQVDVEQGWDDLTQLISDLTGELYEGQAAVVGTGDAWNLADQAGRDAYETIRDQIYGMNDLMVTAQENGASHEELSRIYSSNRDRLVDVMVQMGWNRSEAKAYVDQLLATPEDISTAVNLDTSAAEAALTAFVTKRRVVVVDVDVNGMPSGTIVRPGQVGRFADGGRIPGYAPGYDDRIGFLRDGTVVGLGGGEYIVPTLATDRYLPYLEAMRAGTFKGYANGGLLSSPTYSPAPVINIAAPSGAGGDGLSIGQITFQADGSRLQPQIDSVMHAFRTYHRGGRR